MEAADTNAHVIDLAESTLRQANAVLQSRNGTDESGHFRILNPKGAHALACGLDAPHSVEIAGHAGYYCAGMNKFADVLVEGNAGQGVAENMMSGSVRVMGDASQSAGATAHGGTLIIEGNAGARCGISLKGAEIIVKGDVGHMSMFMAQAGTLVVFGDAGDSLGDSIYEARIYVGGRTGTLGADCEEKPMEEKHRKELRRIFERAALAEADLKSFRRFGSARRLYNFDIKNVGEY